MLDTHLVNASVARDVIRVIRAEMERRSPRVLDDSQDAIEAAYEHWLFSDEPFLNELCLLLLTALRHQVERELIKIAARITDDGQELTSEQYQRRLEAEHEQLKKNGWKLLIAKLKLKTRSEWNSSMETLRLLANCYKHDTSQRADKDLLKHPGCDMSLNYLPLAESSYLRQDLAVSLGLNNEAYYCEVTEELLNRAERFLAEVREQPMVSKVRGGKAKLSQSAGD